MTTTCKQSMALLHLLHLVVFSGAVNLFNFTRDIFPNISKAEIFAKIKHRENFVLLLKLMRHAR